jgi:hypothetical protein
VRFAGKQNDQILHRSHQCLLAHSGTASTQQKKIMHKLSKHKHGKLKYRIADFHEVNQIRP